jgi:hypothetical protein
MYKIGTSPQVRPTGASLTLLLVFGTVAAVLTAVPAHASLITNSFIGFPPDPFVQQDKTWGGWTDVTGNLPSGFTTLITTRPNIVVGEDLHTFTLSAAFLANTTYVVSYYIMVNTSGVGMIEASAGVVQTVGAATISTVLTNVPFTLPTTSSATGLLTVPGGPYTLFDVTDTIITGSGSDISGFSNSYLEHVTVPEPGTLAMFGSAVLAIAGLLRRNAPK